MAKSKVPWIKEYKVCGIPKSLFPYPNEPVHDILYKAAKKYKKMGVVQMNYLMTYPELKDNVDRLATAFYNMGLKKGDRVATILPTSIQFEIVEYALSRAGLVHIPSSNLETVEILAHKFREGSPKAIVTLDSQMDLIEKLNETVKIDHLIFTKLEEYSDNKPESFENISFKNGVWMKDLIKNNNPEPPEIEFDVENDVQLLLFTGGTTGLPKGCMLSHRNIYANALQNRAGFGKLNEASCGALSVLVGVPFFHSYGHMIMHVIVMMGYTQLLITDSRDTKAMVSMIKEYRPFLQFGVPTQFMKLAQEDLKDVGMIGISGSAPLAQNTQKDFEEKAKSGIMEGYGLSEMSPTTHLNTSLIHRICGGRVPALVINSFLSIPGVSRMNNKLLIFNGSKRNGEVLSWLVSRTMNKKPKVQKEGAIAKKSHEKRGTIGIPFPDTEVRLVDVDTGKILTWEDVKAGKTGEMHLKGPQRMLGYWPEAGSGICKDGFVNTSDVVRIDERGYFYIVDRTKDMIIVSGFKVYSREIDEVLCDHPKIDIGATIGVPDPEREGSERVAVYIQPKPQYIGNITREEIIEYLKPKVAKYAVPKIIQFIDQIPVTSVEKIDKKKLREMAESIT